MTAVDQRDASPATLPACPSRDVVHAGAEAIAARVFGDARQRRKVYHAAEKGYLPIFRVGATLCMRESAFLAFVEKQESTSTNRN